MFVGLPAEGPIARVGRVSAAAMVTCRKFFSLPPLRAMRMMLVINNMHPHRPRRPAGAAEVVAHRKFLLFPRGPRDHQHARIK
jgi:hypothetical protein